MACCGGGDDEQSAMNKRIQADLKRDRKKLSSLIRILLLGAGESGKSTIAKQFRLINSTDFDAEEREEYLDIIHENTYNAMVQILSGGLDLGMKVKSKELREVAHAIAEDTFEQWDGMLTKEIAVTLSELWKDKGVQKMYESRAQFQVIDCAEYYLSDVARLAQTGYVPNNDDILRSRVKTTGVLETTFSIEGNQFVIVDVGGQRSERRKWMACFVDCTAVLFVVALSAYDLKCSEDNQTNRMQESLELFASIVNSKWFAEIPVMLFLNKTDLFREKLATGKTSLSLAFPDFDLEPPYDYEQCCEFIEDKFNEQMIKKAGRRLYVHGTCATDTKDVEAVWLIVRDIVLSQALARSGLASMA